ncbi:hypothetical protein CH75_06450 [Dyella jiangningensis]|nr:hypothetical protein CH75_06450 [Dyella jiangningensis]
MTTTAEHIEHRTIKDFAVDPDHVERAESAEFRAAKKRLREDGHYVCWVASCRSTDKLQVHHLGAEWMFENVVDFDRLKAFLLSFDPYGYSRLLQHQPITSVDDIRNMLVICQCHHTGVNHEDGSGGTGIHSCTFPTWAAQCVTVDGGNPIPQPGETFDQAMARIKKHER